jgi:hypothetical protein
MSIGRSAARFARQAARNKGKDFRQLSAKMCWDAVKHCVVQAAPFLGKNRYKHIDAKMGLVSSGDPEVRSAAEMRTVPEGSILGFFDGDTPIHVMVSLGGGWAAGNKNDCVGVGSPVGWEELNLAERLWTEEAVRVRTRGGNRTVTIHHRRIG